MTKQTGVPKNTLTAASKTKSSTSKKTKSASKKAKSLVSRQVTQASMSEKHRAAFGLNDIALAFTKAELVDELVAVIWARDLARDEAAKIVKLSQTKIAGICSGRNFKTHSIDELLRYLNRLGVNVTIKLDRNKKWDKGHLFCQNMSELSPPLPPAWFPKSMR